MQAVSSGQRTPQFWSGEAVALQWSRPSSNLATGMALRAFAAHPGYRLRPEVVAAGSLLKSRFLEADRYYDRQDPSYWLKFQFPFWWSNLLTALDSLSSIGFKADDDDIADGLEWFCTHQQKDGLWPTGYDSGQNAGANRHWVGLAACRMLKRFYQGKVN